MNFTKTYGVFLLTFILGCGVFFAFVYLNTTNLDDVLSQNTNTNTYKKESIAVEPKLEVIEQISNHLSDEEDKSYTIKLLETGEGFHGDEVSAKNGEKWLGLFEEDGKFVLKSTKLKIKRVHDGIIDDGTNKKTGKSVIVNTKIDPMFLLKNSTLKEGEVKSLLRGKNWKDWNKLTEDSVKNSEDYFTSIKKGFEKEFELDDKKYSLKVIEALNQENEKILALVLEGLGKRQVLHTSTEKFFDEGYGLGTLYWVGDLDKDGKLDIYFSPHVHYNVANRVLLLSSKAKENKLLEKVAYFWTTGC